MLTFAHRPALTASLCRPPPADEEDEDGSDDDEEGSEGSDDEPELEVERRSRALDRAAARRAAEAEAEARDMAEGDGMETNIQVGGWWVGGVWNRCQWCLCAC